MTKKCCLLNTDILIYPNIPKGNQTATLCHNLIQMAKTRRPQNTFVAEVLELEARDIWKCNLKGKKGYTWKNITDHDWRLK